MNKRLFALFILMLLIVGCNGSNGTSSTLLSDYACKDNIYSEGCFSAISPEIDSENKEDEEITFDETFELDMVNSQPFSWLLFRSDIYKYDTVEAKVLSKDDVEFITPTGDKVLRLYSQGNVEPLYYPKSTLIFTRKFNLHEKGYGVAEATILIPENQGNEINFEVVTGSANIIGIEINPDLNGKVNVIAGDVFYFYQGTTVVEPTNLIIEKNTWYTFRLEWNINEDKVAAYYYDNETGDLIKLYEGNFHQSVRFNTKKDGEPLAPDHIRFSMPFNVTKNGYAFVDSVKVASKIDPSLFVNPNGGDQE
jgi:hypothetical protein